MYSKFFKRLFDILLSLSAITFLALPMLIIARVIKIDDPGPVFFKQKRVGINKTHFTLLKYRTMKTSTPHDVPTHLMTNPEQYITRVGRFLRKSSLDELPQIFNVISGTMSFVGTRPEVPKYVDRYEDEYYATLLLPAGITSLTSILYKDEDELLAYAEDADEVYINTILPEKMKYNLQYTREFGFFSDIKIMFKTVIEVVS